MPSAFNKIHRLKRLWTWDQFVEQYEIGPDIKTLKSIYRYPHHKPNRHSVALIDQIHATQFPSPFPQEVDGLLDLYENMSRSDQTTNQEQQITKLESFVRFEIRSFPSAEPLRDARLAWLLGDMLFDQILKVRNARRWEHLESAKKEAVNYYQLALEIMETKTELNEVTRYKVRQNILACYLNAAKRKGLWTEDADTLNYFHSSQFLTKTKEVLELEPFNWNLARNGLRFSSLLQDKSNSEYFFNNMVQASRLFLDLNYEPFETPALAKSKDFEWSVKHVLTPSLLTKLNP